MEACTWSISVRISSKDKSASAWPFVTESPDWTRTCSINRPSGTVSGVPAPGDIWPETVKLCVTTPWYGAVTVTTGIVEAAVPRTSRVSRNISARKRSIAVPECHCAGLASATARRRCLIFRITSKTIILSLPRLSGPLPGTFARNGKPESKGAASTGWRPSQGPTVLCPDWPGR